MTQTTDTDLRELRDLILGLDKRIDGLDKKMDVYIAQSTEQFKNIDTQLSDIKIQIRAQDTRLWGFIATLSVTTIGLLSKLAFFPKV